MYTPPAHYLHVRDDASANGGLSRQNIIIIAACAGGGGLLLVLFFYHTIRSCMRSGDPAPLPPVQPLAHHRELHLAKIEETLASRPQTWYSSTPPPAPQSIGSKTSLLGRNSPALSPSSSASPIPFNSQLVDLPSPNHLSLPSPSYHADSSSLHSSDASCSPLPSETSSALALPRSIVDLRSSHTPNRRTRPLSTSSLGSFNSRTSRNTIRGAPHSPYSEVQIVLPTPLASVNNSRDSLSPNDPRFGSYTRRSVADPWLSVELSSANGNEHPRESLEDPHPTSRRRRRPASLSSLRSEITAQDQPIPPPVPQLPSNLEKTGRGPADPRWTPSNGTLQESETEADPRKR